MPIKLTEVRTLLADRDLSEEELDNVREVLYKQHKVVVLFTERLVKPGHAETACTKLTISCPLRWVVSV